MGTLKMSKKDLLNFIENKISKNDFELLQKWIQQREKSFLFINRKFDIVVDDSLSYLISARLCDNIVFRKIK